MAGVTNSDRGRDTLTAVLSSFELRDVLRLDLAFGLIGAGAGVYAALDAPEVLSSVAGTTAQMFGVIVGLALAAVAVQSAFMNQAFLRKTKAIGRDPVRYLEPMLFTVALGVFGIVAVIVLSALSPTAPPAVLAVIAGLSGLFVAWTLGSMLYNLSSLISFVRLQADAADIPDDLDIITPRASPKPNDGRGDAAEQ
jgi:hypothetical protein